MSQVTMTLYQALQQKKIMESQMDKIKSYSMTDIKFKNKDKNSAGVEIETVDKQIQSGYDASFSRLSNYINLKAAINEANAKVMVTIGGKEYSIANALMRQRLVDMEENLWRRQIQNIQAQEREIEVINKRANDPDEISSYIKNTLGDASKKSTDMIEELKKNYILDREVVLYDPKGIKEIAEKKLEEIAKFREEIHFALTQANIQNEITVEFED